MDKQAVNEYPINELIQKRWSPRAFSPAPVQTEKLLSLFEAARWAPSAMNLQPWSFIYALSEDVENFQRVQSALSDSNARWASSAPLLIVAVASVDRPDGRPNGSAFYDLGQAVAYLSLQATELGLSVHQIGGFDKEMARSILNIPSGYEPVTMIAVGYHPGDISRLPEDLQKREMASRIRKPLPEFVFEGQWNEPARTKKPEAA